jgi:hypothetical protein
MGINIGVVGAISFFELLVKKCNLGHQLHFFIRITHSAKLPGKRKGHQRKAEQIDLIWRIRQAGIITDSACL